MKQLPIIALFLTLTFGPALGQGLPQPGDFYLISRTSAGDFVGSHKIFRRPAPGLRQVTYCNRTYWVRPYTVAWTQLEFENKREVRVEFNQSKGWRPLCERPEQQVTLKDLGIDIEAADVAREDVIDDNQQSLASRFSAIGSAFRK